MGFLGISCSQLFDEAIDRTRSQVKRLSSLTKHSDTTGETSKHPTTIYHNERRILGFWEFAQTAETALHFNPITAPPPPWHPLQDTVGGFLVAINCIENPCCCLRWLWGRRGGGRNQRNQLIRRTRRRRRRSGRACPSQLPLQQLLLVDDVTYCKVSGHAAR